MDVDKLISEAWNIYEEARKLLEEGDIRDAAEKAWIAVEIMRKNNNGCG
ncbi:MAG: PaREP1 family protein [Candidatus Njordarchaeota archaeon]